ncbi:MAG: lipoate--protein ligase [Ignavibacteria bacterium]
MVLIDNNNITDATVNLALEEYSVRNLDTSNEDYVLFYINSPSIIIGKHQCTIEEINYPYVREKNIQVVRRISGGGAVYHDFGNLNFSFITRHTDDNINNFKKFTQPVIEALRSLGISAETTGRNDIVVDERKISGNAQFTNLNSMFSHGTLLFDSNLDDVVQALNVKLDKIKSKGIKSIRSRVANIKEFLKSPMSIEEFKSVLIQHIFKGEPHIYRLDEKQWEEVYKLSNTKYRNWEWNFGRSPEFNIQKIHRYDFGQIDARIEVKDGIIQNIKLYGDFLGQGDEAEIEKLLIGIKYKENDILRALKNVNLNFYFGNISKENFAKFLCH